MMSRLLSPACSSRTCAPGQKEGPKLPLVYDGILYTDVSLSLYIYIHTIQTYIYIHILFLQCVNTYIDMCREAVGSGSKGL